MQLVGAVVHIVPQDVTVEGGTEPPGDDVVVGDEEAGRNANPDENAEEASVAKSHGINLVTIQE
jgi:hypothetical protein